MHGNKNLAKLNLQSNTTPKGDLNYLKNIPTAIIPIIKAKKTLFNEIRVNFPESVRKMNLSVEKKTHGMCEGLIFTNRNNEKVFGKLDQQFDWQSQEDGCNKGDVSLKSMIVAKTLYNLGVGAEVVWVLDEEGRIITLSKDLHKKVLKDLHKKGNTVSMEGEDIKDKYPDEYKRVKNITYILNLSDVLDVNQFQLAEERKIKLELRFPIFAQITALEKECKSNPKEDIKTQFEKLVSRAKKDNADGFRRYERCKECMDYVKKNPKRETLRNAAFVEKKGKESKIKIFDYLVEEPDLSIPKPNKLENITKFAKIDSKGTFVNDKGFRADKTLKKADFKTIAEYSFKQALKEYSRLKKLEIPHKVIDSLDFTNTSETTPEIMKIIKFPETSKVKSLLSPEERESRKLSEQETRKLVDAVGFFKDVIARERELRLKSESGSFKLPPIVDRPIQL
jgi:hypothetical protein